MTAITQEALAARGIRVKALEWAYHQNRGIWSARDGFGTAYAVVDGQWWRPGEERDIPVDGGDEAAKAAAQSDYAARILAALEVTHD